MSRRYLSVGVALLAYLLVFYISWLTPMHSDDFSYYNMGLGLENHLAHYRAWSGRFAADYISALILSLDSQTAKAALTALALVGAIQMISRMPGVWFGGREQPGTFVFLFLLYWSGCLILGQTVFWTVGAANYLFPLFFVVLYLFLFSQYAQVNAGKWKYFFPMLVAGVLAGCSNESTGWVVVVLSLMGAVYLHRQRRDKAIWLSFVLVLAGFLVLLFSPGNAARSMHPDFAGFYETSLFSRLWYFTFFSGLPKLLVKLSPFLLMAMLLLFLAKRAGVSKANCYFSLLFVACALLGAYSMVMSPTFPSRSLSGAIFFLLIACAFTYAPLSESTLAWVRRWQYGLLIMTGGFAIVAYAAMAFSYQRVALQALVRLEIIGQSKAAGSRVAAVPAFFYPPSLRRDDALDEYHNEEAAGAYHGLEKVVQVPTDYDYAVLLDGRQQQVSVSGSMGAQRVFDTLALGRAGLRGGTTAVFYSADTALDTKIVPGKTVLNVVFVRHNGSQVSHDMPLVLQPAPGGWMVGARVPLSLNDIQSVSYRLLDVEGKELSEGDADSPRSAGN